MDISEVQIAWLAGIFEGEGTTFVKGGRPEVSFATTDEDVVRRFSALIGFGKVNGPYQQRPEKKPFWIWQIGTWPEFFYFKTLFEPYLFARRRAQFEHVASHFTRMKCRTRSYKRFGQYLPDSTLAPIQR